MAKNTYFNLAQTKRYYYLIAFKYDVQYTTQDFFKDCGIKKNDIQKVYDDDGLIVEHGKITNNIRFYSGTQDYSVNGDGLPPFQYDVLAIEMRKLNTIVLGFPFKLLASIVTENLINNKKLLSKGSFLKPLLNKLIVLYNSNKINKHFSTFSGIELMLGAGGNLRLVSLYGEAPLESPIYQKIFSELLDNEKCKLEKCSLKFEIDENVQRNLPSTRANVHLDLFGNYKLYVHTGKNIFTIPSVFSLLEKHKCWAKTLTNPISRLHEDPV